MRNPKSAPKELFSSPEDVIRAHTIVRQMLGPNTDVNCLALPKSTGVMGDSGVRGNSVVISARTDHDTESICTDYTKLAETATRITNETGATTRVLFDITPGIGYFRHAYDDKS